MSMDLVLTFLFLVAGFGFLAVLINKKLTVFGQRSELEQPLLEWLKSMQVSINETQRTLNEAMRSSSGELTRTLQENTRQLNERMDKTASVIRDVSREVGQMSEIGRGMKELQEFLRSPKLRGNIGEQVLKDLISQMFPKNSFHLQYQFKSGERVDAAIKTDAGILPIDSKFPMENFQKMTKSEQPSDRESAKREFVRDVKKHIDDISKKYILPAEGTMDFALMYIPSESVFYEIVGMAEIDDYARRARVYPVSPSTLYAHLQMILLSFEGKKIETKSREVFRMLRALQGDYDRVGESIEVLGKHITNASSQFYHVSSRFLSMGQKLSSAQDLGGAGEDDSHKLSTQLRP